MLFLLWGEPARPTPTPSPNMRKRTLDLIHRRLNSRTTGVPLALGQSGVTLIRRPVIVPSNRTSPVFPGKAGRKAGPPGRPQALPGKAGRKAGPPRRPQALPVRRAGKPDLQDDPQHFPARRAGKPDLRYYPKQAWISEPLEKCDPNRPRNRQPGYQHTPK